MSISDFFMMAYNTSGKNYVIIMWKQHQFVLTALNLHDVLCLDSTVDVMFGLLIH